MYVFSRIYKPLLIGAVTTAAAFLALCFARSRGLYHMGLMGAIGISCAFIVTTVLLPIGLTLIPIKTIIKIRQADGQWLCAFQMFSSKGRFITAVVLILLLSSLGAARVRFSSDQNKLADQTLPSYMLQNKLQDEYGLSLVPIAFVSPDRKTEQAKLRFLESIPDSPFSLIQSYTLAQYRNETADQFVGSDGMYLTLAYPAGNAFEPKTFRKIESVAEKCNQHFPTRGNRVTGSPFLNAGLNRTIRADLVRCSVLAGMFVFLLVFSCFRKLPRTFAAILPVTLGVILMIGSMGFLNIDFTLMTIVIVPLVIGSGIDDGVHLLSRWYAEQKDIVRTIRSVAAPIIGTTLTSMIGLGSLILSSNPGFRQLGLTVTLGLAFCLLISLLILPSMLNVFEKRGVHE